MNYGDIKQYVRDQLHRTDLTDALFDSWQSVVTPRVVRDVQYVAGITQTTIITTTDPSFTLPADVDEVLEIYTGINGSIVKLSPTSRERFRLVSNANGESPRYYQLQGNVVEFTPGGADREYTLRYRAKVESMVNDSDESDLAAAHPQMIIMGLMREAYWYLRDFEGVSAATETYTSEAKAIKDRAAFTQQGDNPQMTGASQWV